jgi:hypothetical protein
MPGPVEPQAGPASPEVEMLSSKESFDQTIRYLAPGSGPGDWGNSMLLGQRSASPSIPTSTPRSVRSSSQSISSSAIGRTGDSHSGTRMSLFPIPPRASRDQGLRLRLVSGPIPPGVGQDCHAHQNSPDRHEDESSTRDAVILPSAEPRKFVHQSRRPRLVSCSA